jgi:hypothetical protein
MLVSIVMAVLPQLHVQLDKIVGGAYGREL